MTTTQSIVEARHKRALAYADKVEWEITEVPSDDFGDTQWKYRVVFYIVLKGRRYDLYDDYYRVKPDAVQIYNNMLESIRDGYMGDNLADVISQTE